MTGEATIWLTSLPKKGAKTHRVNWHIRRAIDHAEDAALRAALQLGITTHAANNVQVSSTKPDGSKTVNLVRDSEGMPKHKRKSKPKPTEVSQPEPVIPVIAISEHAETTIIASSDDELQVAPSNTVYRRARKTGKKRNHPTTASTSRKTLRVAPTSEYIQRITQRLLAAAAEVSDDDAGTTQRSYVPPCFMDSEACSQLAKLQAVNCSTLFEGPLFNAGRASEGVSNAMPGPESDLPSEAAAVVVSPDSTCEPPTMYDAHSCEGSSVCLLSHHGSVRPEVPPLTDSYFSFSYVPDTCRTHKSTHTNDSVVPLHESFLRHKRVLQTEATWVRGSKRLKSDIKVIVGT